jgi:hypothetical protein
LGSAEEKLDEALAHLRSHPVPIVAWKVYAALGRLREESGNDYGAREAFAQAVVIINRIAASVSDESLSKTFLTSTAVREVLEKGCGGRGG